MSGMLRIFIGWDADEIVAYHVLAHSIVARAGVPVSIAPLARHQLGALHPRERGPLDSTDFSITRFLVPHLCGYEGWALYLDCDMLMRADVAELWALRDDAYALMCVKHDYTPRDDVKFLGRTQTRYEKKNWSSVMLFNNRRCRALTPDRVATAPGLHLHRFEWLEDPAAIGALPSTWNHLVGEHVNGPRADDPPKLIHYTRGGPWFEASRDCEYADEWRAEQAAMGSARAR